MSAGVSGNLHLRVISQGTILHALEKPEEVSKPIIRFPNWHVWNVPVTDIEDLAITVDFSTRRDKIDVTASKRAVSGIGAGYGGVGRGGGNGGDGEEEERVC